MKISINHSPIKIKRVRNKNTPPIILINRSTEAYLYPEKPILLHSNGNISCGDKTFKNRPATYYFKDYYSNFFDYLKKKRLPMSVDRFRKKDLGDIIEDMRSNEKKSISLKRLLEIYSRENQIARLKRIAIDRLINLEKKRWWKEYKRLLDANNYNEAQKMRDQFEEKRKTESDIINFRK